ncbi:MAG: hypothetical protein AB8B50_02875 [Pirellulaceae bacterium]
MANGFWTGGSSAYAKGLSEQYKKAKQALQEKIDTCSEEDRAALEREAGELEKERQSKLGGIGDCIF